MRLHPQEAKLQAARAWQRSPAFDDFRKQRQVVEHRIARLLQLGIRQARYFGRRKTLFQVLLAATVANLTLVASQAAHGTPPTGVRALFSALLAILRRLLPPIRQLSRVSGPATVVIGTITALRTGPAEMAVFRPGL